MEGFPEPSVGREAEDVTWIPRLTESHQQLDYKLVKHRGAGSSAGYFPRGRAWGSLFLCVCVCAVGPGDGEGVLMAVNLDASSRFDESTLIS